MPTVSLGRWGSGGRPPRTVLPPHGKRYLVFLHVHIPYLPCFTFVHRQYLLCFTCPLHSAPCSKSDVLFLVSEHILQECIHLVRHEEIWHRSDCLRQAQGNDEDLKWEAIMSVTLASTDAQQTFITDDEYSLNGTMQGSICSKGNSIAGTACLGVTWLDCSLCCCNTNAASHHYTRTVLFSGYKTTNLNKWKLHLFFIIRHFYIYTLIPVCT